MSKIYALIPCFNEEKNIGTIVKECLHYVDKVIVIDNGSTDNTFNIAEGNGASVVRCMNKGMGSALNHGLTFSHYADIIVTLDGDGQHTASDIPQVIKPIICKEADIVVGQRDKSVMPLYRRIGNNIITKFCNVLSPTNIDDTQCGFRAFNKSIFENIDKKEKGFGCITELIIKARVNNYRIKGVPVSCLYHDKHSDNSTMNPIKHGVRVIYSIIKWRIKLETMNMIKTLLFNIFKILVKPFWGHGWGDKYKWLGKPYRFLVLLFMPNGKITKDYGSYKLSVRKKLGNTVSGVALSMLFGGEYEPITTKLFQKFVKPGMTVIDIGANVGHYTILASRLVNGGGRVISLEPEHKNFNELVENIEQNGCTNVVPLKVAASSEDGDGWLYLSSEESGAHSLVDCKRPFKDLMLVPKNRLDTLVNGDRVDFIKMDTEGHEIEVLSGADNILKRDNPDLKMVVECWEQGLVASGHSVNDLLDLLLQHNFVYNYLIEEWDKQIIPCTLEAMMAYIKKRNFSGNILCSRVNIKEKVMEVLL